MNTFAMKLGARGWVRPAAASAVLAIALVAGESLVLEDDPKPVLVAVSVLAIAVAAPLLFRFLAQRVEQSGASLSRTALGVGIASIVTAPLLFAFGLPAVIGGAAVWLGVQGSGRENRRRAYGGALLGALAICFTAAMVFGVE